MGWFFSFKDFIYKFLVHQILKYL